ncbi:MAG: TIM barrel protein [Acidobacteriaceae bacterium]|nr:TIM barrel protein [Acidobacteriaceae bacterium]
MAVARASGGGHGVQVGVCTYSFRELPRVKGDAIGPVIQAMKDCGAHVCELFSPQAEPEDVVLTKLLSDISKPGADGKTPSMEEMRAKYEAARGSPEEKEFREKLRQWRLNTPMGHFEGARQKFASAGIEIFAYTLNFGKDFSDEELDKCFQEAKALRAKAIASSTQVSMLPRLKPLAEKYRITVAVHGHSETGNPDEFSSPETFQKALDLSRWFKVNLDIGHFTAGGFDAAQYIEQQHERISHLHLKDRQKNNGPNKPFGEGDTPIVRVLQLLKHKRYPIPALIEYEYAGAGTPVEEVKKCLAYCRKALAGA